MSTDAPPNRLAHETSPYLLQHARNPVDWYPWGAEALQAAREQDRPIFLSIGYSACHWCHVMEHESFENPEIAALMNQWFINVKVDREERPDLDQIYMNAVVAMTRQGGWPMSVFLTPDLKPFYGGTYWPPTARWGRPGFREILSGVHDAWIDRRSAVEQQAGELTAMVIDAGRPAVTFDKLGIETLRQAQQSLMRSADRTHGGFGSAPKFPHPLDLRVLLRCHRRFGEPQALQIVRLTLDKMAAGGIYDHLGGGFARYSTDERWLVPHFEKMLYDNALLVPVYLEAYQATEDATYLRVVRETLDYVLREMTQPSGGYYSTQDADSEGVEGKFFVWSADEIDRVLGSDDGRIFRTVYDVTPQGNWEHSNILNRPKSLEESAFALGMQVVELGTVLERCRRTLFDVRSARIAPGRDDKILASWNGLMIAAMAQAANVLGDAKYATSAAAAADFVLLQMRRPDGRLWHAFKDGRARFNAYLDDYAAMIDGLVELYQADFHPRWLNEAVALAERMLAQFWDREDAGFFYTSEDHEALITRNKEIHDNATPSGNNLAAMALLKLARITGRRDFEANADATLNMLAGTLARAPMAAGQALLALDFLLGPTYEIVVCGEGDREADWRELFQRFVPNRVVLQRPSDVDDAELPGVLQCLLAGKSAIGQSATVYVCQSGMCQNPLKGTEIGPALRAL
ncbi:MAG: thioredoxin domain-containing protein [Planctomycetaceae bacterium]|nr:thioredoxin domain-containing protein [Planctomycetaceae bacterium]